MTTTIIRVAIASDGAKLHDAITRVLRNGRGVLRGDPDHRRRVPQATT